MGEQGKREGQFTPDCVVNGWQIRHFLSPARSDPRARNIFTQIPTRAAAPFGAMAIACHSVDMSTHIGRRCRKYRMAVAYPIKYSRFPRIATSPPPPSLELGLFKAPLN